jgi:hypothetical protein
VQKRPTCSIGGVRVHGVLRTVLSITAVGVVSLAVSSGSGGFVSTAEAAPTPVSREEFEKQNKLLRILIDRFRKVETTVQEMKKNESAGGDGKVDLEKIDATAGGPPPTGPAAAPTKAGKAGPHGPPLAIPNFKIFFDLNLLHASGRQDAGSWSFQNFHRFVFMELAPTPNVTFSFDFAGQNSPNFYEVDWNITPRTQLRAGKIWIPFDDLSPHNIFGGRVNVNSLQFNGSSVYGVFLPNIWADLGIGLKQTFVDTPKLAVDGHLYLVNGFTDRGSDPAGSGGTAYPEFTDTSAGAADNNAEKSLGGRLTAKFGGVFSVGGSFNLGRYSNQGSKPASVSMFGGDAQLRFTRLELRTGLVSMKADIPDARPTNLASFTRAGSYVEAGYKLGAERAWKMLLRAGSVTLDSRVSNNAYDQQIVGATLLWKPGLIEYSIHHSRDLNDNVRKANRDLSVIRMVVAL